MPKLSREIFFSQQKIVVCWKKSKQREEQFQNNCTTKTQSLVASVFPAQGHNTHNLMLFTNKKKTRGFPFTFFVSRIGDAFWMQPGRTPFDSWWYARNTKLHSSLWHVLLICVRWFVLLICVVDLCSLIVQRKKKEAEGSRKREKKKGEEERRRRRKNNA